MTIIFDEKPESRSWTMADGRGVREYQLIGIFDDVSALLYANAHVPVFISPGAWLQDIQLKPQGADLWFVTCPYGPLPKWPGSIQISFRTTGGTVHIAASKEMVAKYGAGAPDTVIIGQDGDGADITVPVQMRTYTFNFDKGIVSEAAMDYWEDLTGIVNVAPWHGRPAGEVLFLGAEGDTTIAADSKSSVSFQFAMSRNKVGQTIGAIDGIAKQGHDLIDIHTKTQVIAGAEVQKEKYVYIQRVYERLNFTTYLGF